MRTYIKSSEFQSRSELLIIENRLPLTDEVTVDLVLKCLQHLHLLALHSFKLIKKKKTIGVAHKIYIVDTSSDSKNLICKAKEVVKMT